MTLQVSNIAGDGETWRRHVIPKTHRGHMPRLAGKGTQGTGRTAYGIRGYTRSMKRTKCRIQVDKGKRSRNTRAVNYCVVRSRWTQTSGRAGETESAEGTSRDSETHATVGHRRQECNGRLGGNLQGFGSTCTQSGPSSEGRCDIGLWQGQHRQALHTKVAMTQTEGSLALADTEQFAEASQPGRKWTGLMKRCTACVVDPSPGVFFHQPPTGRMGGLCRYR